MFIITFTTGQASFESNTHNVEKVIDKRKRRKTTRFIVPDCRPVRYPPHHGYRDGKKASYIIFEVFTSAIMIGVALKAYSKNKGIGEEKLSFEGSFFLLLLIVRKVYFYELFNC
ncbi:hypothetical protein [Paenisporosarcina indica]|uniref:hypothetical protein n=1 Tax=Paenisporosarcina indica TaxID=650093 RepID=UPI00094F9528|nr:hypothetical protein [Paenisporosarcina indica]